MTKINGITSAECTVTHGVPQGSILGPLLISLNVNDLPDALNEGSISLYADDTAICVSDHNLESMKLKLESVLHDVCRWYRNNKLSVNLKKTHLMFFGTATLLDRMSHISLSLGDTQISKVDVYKYLGITLDSRLSFKDHVNYMKKKTFAKIHLLGKLSYILDRQTLLQLYKTLILPLFDYGDIVYHGLSSRDSDTLHRLRNEACRAILRVDPRTHITEMHDDLSLPKVYQRHNHHIATMHNFVQGNGPPYCQKYVNKVSDRHELNTRSSETMLLVVPKTRLKITEQSFAVIGPKAWNQVPYCIRAFESHDSFKKEL